ncbi:ATP-dependent DNA helicase RecG [Ornithinimicrobium murale]|uniref:ATP-dependent DNA helicase RecG n=1 Tax=Ornithinimicrobium murale TaxID=1050153 RepID=UPI000E0D5B93|nr:ATP-dependent DNA helicase RecG [Ornithinimicrobium murale]
MSWRPSAYLTTAAGDSPRKAPAVALRFAPGRPHPFRAGERMVEWVKDLGQATWDHDAKRWLVTEFDADDPDSDLTRAGFVHVYGDDGHPVRLTGLRSVLVEPAWDTPGMVAVYPRLVPEPRVRSRLGDDAVWQAGHRRWVVPGSRISQIGQRAHWGDLPAQIEPLDNVDATLAPVPEDARSGNLGTDGTFEALRGMDIGLLSSVAPPTLASLRKAGVNTLADLLMRKPRRYIDRSNPLPVTSAADGDEFAFLGTVVSTKAPPPSRRGKGLSLVVVEDAEGTKVTLRWFNAPRITRRFHDGANVLVFGKLEASGARYSMTNPMADVIASSDAAGGGIGLVGSTALIPVYPASPKADLTTWQTRAAVAELLDRMGTLSDVVPADLVSQHDLTDLNTAWTHLHAAPSPEAARAARERLAYNELLRLHLALRLAGSDGTTPTGYRHEVTGNLTKQMLGALPFQPTGAQRRALNAFINDLRTDTPMHRLLQGEVGAGKTLCAAAAALMVVEAGQQAAIMAPTEVLASQHHKEFIARCEGLTKSNGKPVRVELLTTKSVTGKARKTLLADIAAGDVDILVGTHALLSAGVEVPHLSLVVVDEQHRFGVEQRHRLRTPRASDGTTPGLLVMTATPAPRTAAMISFGDLDVSILDEIPAGRSPVATQISTQADLGETNAPAWAAVREALGQERQAFVVSPLVGESEAKAAAGAESMATQLREGALRGHTVQVVHGKQKADERSAIMTAYAAGKVDVLVATTVIEVGVNVPNATVMVITGAEQFGVTQLHQLRGRVGRGKHPGRCFLVPSKEWDELAETSQARLQAVESTTDGFKLAEMDLAIRGPGRVLSGVQAGRASDLVFADLLTDTELIAKAGADATELLTQDPKLARRPTLRADVVSALGEAAGQWLRSS